MVRFNKTSLLTALDGMLLVVIGMAGLVALLSLLDTLTSKTVTDLLISVPDGKLSGVFPPGVVVDGVQAVVAARTGLGYRLAWWFTGPAASLLVVAGAYILRELVSTARTGDPFVALNVRRLRMLGFLTFAHFLSTAAQSLVAVAIRADLGLDEVSTEFSLVPIVSALVLFALAEIWQRGVAMRDEQQLTV